MALNLMRYDGSSSYNMVKLATWSFFCAKYVSFGGFIKTWAPFAILVTIAAVAAALI